jgi:predicted ATPase
MNFELRNFGKIYEADVKLDGITVICGDNNTGKSTVGKALFSFYNSLYDYKARIKDRIDEKLTSYLLDYISKKSDILIDTLSTQTIDEVREIIKKMQEIITKLLKIKTIYCLKMMF